jgi:FKBP-type peptidyl-prolyl cis-trans isomerase 2
MVVSLAYVLRLEYGAVFDHAGETEPLQITQGAGEVIAGLEEALDGMGVGEEKDVAIPPEKGYGFYDRNNVNVLARSVFPADLDLTVGRGVRLRDRRRDEIVTGYVAQVGEEEVMVDFNHPLAGETLHVHVKVVGISDDRADNAAPDGVDSEVG